MSAAPIFVVRPDFVFQVKDSIVSIAEASDLGLRPGQWPEFVTVGSTLYEKHRPIQNGGWAYVANDGTVLEILND